MRLLTSSKHSSGRKSSGFSKRLYGSVKWSGGSQEFEDGLVWLEPLDMEPVPRSLNLLLAILARINAATLVIRIAK